MEVILIFGMICIEKDEITAIKNVDDVLCLPRAIAVGVAHAEYQNDPLNNNMRKRFQTMKQNYRGKGFRCTFSLQKLTALEYKKKCRYTI